MELDQDLCYQAFVARDRRMDGRAFAGVRTTGIYCRPICPARTPKRENVHFYPSAAAAQEAGFRACLRCRPEAAPDSAAWSGTDAIVRRGLRLIEAGALDTQDCAALAGRLGVGERHLRRLFRAHLGASPISVAQTRRVLLAQQLIAQTSLSMVQVAFASGFGSARRFNETFQALYGRAPASLRRRAAKAEPASEGATNWVRLVLPVREPFDWPLMLGFWRARALSGVEVVSPQTYARTFSLEGVDGVLRLSCPRPDALLAEVRFLGGEQVLSLLPKVLARVRMMTDAGADVQAIGQQLRADPVLAACLDARPGLRVMGQFDAFEQAVRAVLGQQISVQAGVMLAQRLLVLAGRPLDTGEPGLTHVFPDAIALARADLAALPMPAARRQTLSVLAGAVCEDPELLVPGQSLEASLARLTALKGIGDWTAQYIAMRALKEPDAFPAGDVALQRAVHGKGGERLDAPALSARAQAWRPWRAYAAQHLWMKDLEHGT